MRIHCLIVATAWFTAGTSFAETPRHPRVDGFSGSVGLDYDGSRERTDALRLGAELEWGSKERWMTLAFDAYGDFTGNWALSSNTDVTLTLGTALWRDPASRSYVNATFAVDIPSEQASRGADITPEINFAKGLTEEFWIGGSIDAVIATSPDVGNRRGYCSVTFWAYWESSWLPNESDAFTFTVWAATNEVPGDDNSLSLSLEYTFDLVDDVEFTVGVGTDVISPWEHLGVYGTAGLRWWF